jgi:hypothetical protein
MAALSKVDPDDVRGYIKTAAWIRVQLGLLYCKGLFTFYCREHRGELLANDGGKMTRPTLRRSEILKKSSRNFTPNDIWTETSEDFNIETWAPEEIFPQYWMYSLSSGLPLISDHLNQTNPVIFYLSFPFFFFFWFGIIYVQLSITHWHKLVTDTNTSHGFKTWCMP